MEPEHSSKEQYFLDLAINDITQLRKPLLKLPAR